MRLKLQIIEETDQQGPVPVRLPAVMQVAPVPVAARGANELTD